MDNQERKRIAIDMDEVLADTLSHYLGEYNREFGAPPLRDITKLRQIPLGE